MDFAQLLRRTWSIIWEHKFLIVLGILVALGSGGGGGGNATGGGRFDFNFGQPDQDFAFPTPPAGEMPEMPGLPDLGQIGLPTINIALVLVLVSLAALVGIAVWIVSTIARGGLIAGASTIDAGGVSSFSAAWSAGWQRGWRLLGISILPAIPGFFLFLVGLLSFAVAAGVTGFFGTDIGVGSLVGLGGVMTLATCIITPVAMVLGLLRAFANRACVLEDLGVFAAYKRGLDVLVENIGPAILLFVLQVAINIGIGLVMILPGIVMALCCILWPVLIVIQGAIAAYFSTMWTLAWREWTGASQVVATAA
ncbi:MAG: hypothetical protein PVI59_09370 [Anaerolineae bacterium]|jgi:hypothetical protein